MTDANDFYPPGPREVPRRLTRVGLNYRLRVAAMIGGLFAFLILYLVLIAGAGAVAFFLLTMPLGDLDGVGIVGLLLIKAGGPITAGLFAVFLIKGLFKGRWVEPSALVALEENEHPELFAFIRRVYQEAGAIEPRYVYVSADANAALIYNSSLLSLVVPPPKDLHIGLGLVNTLNLTEFKAVLAHEFGHFAQQSVGLSSYLYVANQVMHDVLYGRDALDRFVDHWSEQDIRIAFPALGLKLALSGVRKVLGGLYHGLNVIHYSLCREMEFNADNVAVRLTGSDALIHVLARMPFTNECLADAAHSLNAAADHELFTDDLFYHQSRSAERLRRVRKDPRLGLPPDHSSENDRVFRPVDDGIPEKYRTHPTDYAREQNAKRTYVPGPRDDRSAWILFRGAADLRREVTDIFYRKVLNRGEWYTSRPAAEVQAFIDAEHAEMTYDPRYHGWYDERFISPGDVELPPLKPWSPGRITAWLSDWPPADLGGRVERLRELQEDERVLSDIESGRVQVEGRTFGYRDREYSRRDVRRLLADVQAELKRVGQSFTDLDRHVFEAHWSLASHLDLDDARGRVSDLRDRYQFHMTVQGLFARLVAAQGQLQNIFAFLSCNPEPAQEDFFEVQSVLQGIQLTLKESVMDARRVKIPDLTNVSDGMRLDELIADRSDTRLTGLYEDAITGEYLAGLGTRLEAMIARLRRLHFKSLGGLLTCQERLAAEWTARAASTNVPVVGDRPAPVPAVTVAAQRLTSAMQRMNRPSDG